MSLRYSINATRKDIAVSTRKNFLFYGLPGVFWWAFIAYVVLNGLNANIFDSEIIIPSVFVDGELWGGILMYTIPAIIGMVIGVAVFPYILILIAFVVFVGIPLSVLSLLFVVPIDAFEYGHFIFDNWFLFVMAIMSILAVIGAFRDNFPILELSGSGLDLNCDCCCDCDNFDCEDCCDCDYLCDNWCDSCCCDCDNEDWLLDAIYIVLRTLLIIVGGLVIFFIVNNDETSSDRKYLKTLKNRLGRKSVR